MLTNQYGSKKLKQEVKLTPLCKKANIMVVFDFFLSIVGSLKLDKFAIFRQIGKYLRGLIVATGLIKELS